MSGPDPVNEALVLLSRQFGLGRPDDLPAEPPMSLDELRRFVAGKVAALLDANPSLLMSILYRVDVAERDVKRVLEESDPTRIPVELADLLIGRQLDKIRTRRAYGSGKT